MVHIRYALSAFGGTPPKAVARRAPSTTRIPLLRKKKIALLHEIFKYYMNILFNVQFPKDYAIK